MSNKRWPTIDEVVTLSKQLDSLMLTQGERLRALTTDVRALFDKHQTTIEDSIVLMFWLMRQLRSDPDLPKGMAAILLAAREQFPIQLSHTPLELGTFADFTNEGDAEPEEEEAPTPTPPRGKLRVVH